MNDLYETLAIVSGGFDPIHKGHIHYINEAARHGRVAVLLNSDPWLMEKKGFVFQDWEERCIIVGSLRNVAVVHPVDDRDGTVVQGIKRLQVMYPRTRLVFLNGGDRGKKNTPEAEYCSQQGIDMVFGAGGKKVQSSSKLTEQIRNTK